MTIEVQPFRGRYRVVMRHDNGTVTVLGTFNAKHKAEHEAQLHRDQLGWARDNANAADSVDRATAQRILAEHDDG